ncbi:MAG: HDOD domain-containing protein [Nitrospira sp.]|nr:MAG: HDOD domain-containing protein [Nitrospira sp.]
MKHLLFVDDEPRILEGLQRSLWGLRHEWAARFVTSGEQAIAALQESLCEILIVDMRMPFMDGAELLRQVQKEHPSVIRLILSGQSDQESAYRAVGYAHQYLSKPCEPANLKATFKRLHHLCTLCDTESVRSVLTGLRGLPTQPQVYQEVCTALREGSSPKAIGSIMAHDPGMTSRILQLVNSSFFGPRHTINSVELAAEYLGIEVIKVLMESLDHCSRATHGEDADVAHERLWKHSLAVATLAKAIAQDLHFSPALIDAAFAAGLLHDVGMLLLGMEPEAAPHSAEQESVVNSHAGMGAYLLGLWGLSDPIVEAVAYHHEPHRCIQRGLSPLTAVHLAEALLSASSPGENPVKLLRRDDAYVEALGLTQQVKQWERNFPI